MLRLTLSTIETRTPFDFAQGERYLTKAFVRTHVAPFVVSLSNHERVLPTCYKNRLFGLKRYNFSVISVDNLQIVL